MPLLNPPSSIFPTYLTPNIPFRRRSSNTTTSSSNAAAVFPGSLLSLPSNSSLPPAKSTYLTDHSSILRCARCLTHLCSADQIISKGFTGRHGRAYLVAPANAYAAISVDAAIPQHQSAANLPNTHVHKPVPRRLVTGAHTVSDISCTVCGAVLGWKYVAAEEESQRYKVGKFILETKRVLRGLCWEHEDGADHAQKKIEVDASVFRTEEDDGQPLEFDSQNEDECEDLFMGIWSEALARKRRKARAWKKDE